MALSHNFQSTLHRWEYEEHKCWDPKYGELCLARLNSGESLMEDCSNSDVQIDRDENARCFYLNWSRRP